MPRRNIIKEYGAGEYYHVYNRGVEKIQIFRDDQDYVFLLRLLKAYLSPEVSFDDRGRELPNYSDKVELVAYCLMPTHYHFFVHLLESDGLEKLMRSVMTTYSRYFNQKYNRTGTLFQNSFLASRVTNESYFWHISRYIHLNPIDLPNGNYPRYPYSSIGYFLGEKHAKWLHEERVVSTAEERVKYASFLGEYEERHEDLKLLEGILAHS